MARVLAHDTFLEHDPGQGGHHVENPDRLRAVHRVLDETGLRRQVDVVEPAPADDAWLHAVHDPDHVARVRELSAAGGGRVDADTVADAATHRAARLASGAAVDAARSALDGEPAFALVRPPGHHATPDRAMGFCFLNHAAVAAAWALDAGGCDRVAVLDHDVHHGNGTQDVFRDRDDVLYASIHQSPLYPGTGFVDETGAGDGEGFTVNLPIWAGTGEAGYARLLDEIVHPVLDAYDPDLLLVSAGFDSHHRDPLGSLHLPSAFFPRMLQGLVDLDAPVACTLEGGYDPVGLARSVAGQVAVLADAEVPRWDETVPAGEGVEAKMDEFRSVHGERWPV